MASPGKTDSGVRSAFSRTCTLLSQYLKENGGFGDLELSLNPSPPVETRETLDLFPKMERSGLGLEFDDGEVFKGNQMTIFYGGEVIVFDDLSPEKANEILMLSGKFSAANNGFHSPVVSLPCFRPIYGVHDLHYRLRRPPTFTTDLPFARKHSLARFLAKRKDRIAANAPYQVSKPPHLKKPINEEPWLGLAPNVHLH